MANDTKAQIAEAARRLLIDKKVKKLTIKDIVDECHITRQAFYYHFADLTELLEWSLKQSEELLYREYRARGGGEDGLRYLILIALNSAPYVRRSMDTNYAAEVEELITKALYHMFERIMSEEGMYQSCTRFQQDLILRYNTQAVMGLLRTWTDEDTKNTDRIIHDIYAYVSGELKP